MALSFKFEFELYLDLARSQHQAPRRQLSAGAAPMWSLGQIEPVELSQTAPAFDQIWTETLRGIYYAEYLLRVKN